MKNKDFSLRKLSYSHAFEQFQARNGANSDRPNVRSNKSPFNQIPVDHKYSCIHVDDTYLYMVFYYASQFKNIQENNSPAVAISRGENYFVLSTYEIHNRQNKIILTSRFVIFSLIINFCILYQIEHIHIHVYGLGLFCC